MDDQLYIMITDKFFDSFMDLGTTLQRATWNRLKKTMKNRASRASHLKSLGTNDDLSTINDDNGFRILLYHNPENYNEYWLLSILNHKKNYRRADIINTNNLNLKPIFIEPKEVEAIEADQSRIDCLLPFLDEALLEEAGANETEIKAIKSCKNREKFQKLKKVLFERDSRGYRKPELVETLEYIAGEDTTVQLAINWLEKLIKKQQENKYVKPFSVPAVLNNHDDLFDILESNKSLSDWRDFIIGPQLDLITKDYNGSFKINGSGGTGKSVICNFRAARLVEELKPNEKVLFTFFNKNLITDVRNNLKRIGIDFNKIDIVNIDEWIQNYVIEKQPEVEILYDNSKKIEDFWKESIKQEKKIPEKDIDREVNNYRKFYEDKYLPCPEMKYDEFLKYFLRRGYKKSELQTTWKIIQNYKKHLDTENILDLNTARYLCLELLKEDPEAEKYRHIIVDEAQDFTEIYYRILRLLVGEEKKNDIFLAGDSKQDIYNSKNDISLSDCGINIKGGRSLKLALNYRNSEEIQEAAEKIIQGAQLNSNFETHYVSSNSYFKREPVSLKYYENIDEEVKDVAQTIDRLIKSGIQPYEICLLARRNGQIDGNGETLGYIDKLKEVNKRLKFYKIEAQGDDITEESRKDYIRIATLHRAKGLEFKAVFVLGVNEDLFPYLERDQKDLRKGEEIAQELIEERISEAKKLLYVGMTRARDYLFISSNDTPADLLKVLENKDVIN